MRCLEGVFDEIEEEELANGGFNGGLGNTQWTLGLSDEEIELLARTNPPPSLSSWKESPFPDEDITATVQGAVTEAAQQADEEHAFLKEQLVDYGVLSSVDEVPRGRQNQRDIIDKLTNWIFGEDSRIYRAFADEISYIRGKGHQHFLKCLSVYFYSCGNRDCAQKEAEDCMYEGGPRHVVVKDGSVSPAEYKTFWSTISLAGMPNQTGRGTTERQQGVLLFWKDLEAALNKLLREFCIKNNPVKKVFVIDDDKVHYSSARRTDRCALKEQQHVRDNRRGFVDHQMVSSASQMIAGIAFEQVGDTVTAATKRLVEGQLIPNVGENTIQQMTNTSFCFDRGYLAWPIILFLVVQHGGDIETSTSKRSQDFILTYDQPANGRIVLDKAGKKLTVRQETALSNNKLLTAHGYQNGNGSVALGMSTIYHANEFDLVLRIPSHQAAYDDEDANKNQWFRQVDGIDELGSEDGIDADGRGHGLMEKHGDEIARGLLWENNHSLWFLLRCLSFTSSTTDRLITALERMGEEGRDVIGIDRCAWDILSEFLNDKNKTRVTEELTNSMASQSEQLEMLSALLESDESVVDQLRDKFSQSLLNDREIRGYVNAFGGKSSGSISTVKGELQKWLDAVPEERPYIIRTLKSLMEEALSRIENFNKSVRPQNGARSRQKTKEEVIEELTRFDQEIGGRQGLNQEETHKLNLTKTLLQSSFLPKLYGKGKEYCKRGHQLEPLLARNLYRDSKNKVRGCPEFLTIYENGMVEKRHEKYIKDSNDFMAVKKIQVADGEEMIKLIPVEMKARLAPAREQQERLRRDAAARRLQATHGRGAKYFSIRSNDENLSAFITDQHEAIQMLHHSYAHESESCILVVGDDSGEIIWVVIVDFEEELKFAYGHVLDVLYQFILKPFYEEDSIPDDEVTERALNSLKVDRKEMELLFGLWKFVSSNMRYPLPPIARIVPRWISAWNAYKSGSDTITKLLDEAPAHLPVLTPQTAVVARILSIAAVVILRCYQLATANKTVKESPSIRAYRQAASVRMTFPNLVSAVASSLQRQAEAHDGQIERDTGQASINPDSRRGNTNTNSRGRGSNATRRRSTSAPASVRRTRQNTAIEHATFHTQTKHTPQKKAFKRYSEDDNCLDSGTKKRFKGCCGLMIHRINSDLLHDADAEPNKNRARLSCLVCGAQTNFYCLGCHHYFCMGLSGPRKKALQSSTGVMDGWDTKYVDFGEDIHSSTEPKKRVVAWKSCHMLSHQSAMQKFIESNVAEDLAMEDLTERFRNVASPGA